MYKDKNILVTGGTGLVGRELVELLVKSGAKVRSISLDDNNLNPLWGAEHFKADLRNIKNCISACAGMDYVFHIAGVKGSPVVMKKFQYQVFRDFNMMNTNVIDAIYNTPSVEWGLYTSTIGTYDGSAGRDIVHARDVARAAMFAVQNKINSPLNVGQGKTFTIKEVIEALVKVSDKGLEITHDLSKPTGDQFRVPITDRLKGHGFEMSVGLEEGLKETFDWYMENGPTEGRYNPFHREEDK